MINLIGEIAPEEQLPLLHLAGEASGIRAAAMEPAHRHERATVSMSWDRASTMSADNN